MKLELISFQRRSWFIPSLARSLNDCMEDEYAFLLEVMKNMRELRTKFYVISLQIGLSLHYLWRSGPLERDQ